MKTCALVLLAVTFPMLTVNLRASGDCGCDGPPVVVHFTDGRSPVEPVTQEPVYGTTDKNCGCEDRFYFRDYGAAHAPVAPPPVDMKEMKHPSS